MTVDCCGSLAPLNHRANVGCPEHRIELAELRGYDPLETSGEHGWRLRLLRQNAALCRRRPLLFIEPVRKGTIVISPSRLAPLRSGIASRILSSRYPMS